VVKYIEFKGKIKTKNMKKSFLFAGGVLVLVILSLFTGYRYWLNGTLDNNLQIAKTSIASIEKEVMAFKNEQITEAISAKRILNNLELDSVQWSQVIKDIRKTVPKNSKGATLVSILSYSGSSGNEITMSVKTSADSKSPYADVSALISSFDDSALFSDAFVPSISTGVDEDGVDILTFSFNCKYLGVQDELSIAR
jgi:Tfp pilus assembly protein PilN